MGTGRRLGVQGHHEQPVLPDVQFKGDEEFGAGGQMILFTEIPFIDAPSLLIIKLALLLLCGRLVGASVKWEECEAHWIF